MTRSINAPSLNRIITVYFAFTFLLYCSEFPNSWGGLQFSLLINIADMLADCWLRFLKQFASRPPRVSFFQGTRGNQGTNAGIYRQKRYPLFLKRPLSIPALTTADFTPQNVGILLFSNHFWHTICCIMVALAAVSTPFYWCQTVEALAVEERMSFCIFTKSMWQCEA